MIFICPYCKKCREVGDIRIPETGVTATCGHCQRQFELHPERRPDEDPARFDPCPSCGLTGIPRGNDDCPRCGLVFAKFRARVGQTSIQRKSAPDDVAFASADETSFFRQVLTSRKFCFVAIAALLAAGIRFGHDWKLDRGYVLQPGNWQGEMTFRGKQHPFLLVIQTTDDGKLEGYMDWTETMPRYRLAIRGTHTGNHLLFEDYKFLEGSGQYGLHDNQDVYIIDNEMSGTAKNGTATLHAVQVATSPDPLRELGKQ